MFLGCFYDVFPERTLFLAVLGQAEELAEERVWLQDVVDCPVKVVSGLGAFL